ncbi:DUF6892 domain-containing protein [Enterococcus sp. BWR-S5]|uniref:DUF6892 domain-containing protein n=1 Tax=Enterococcus sp. BWR-S5 TaxID=2787714 RepID=UPI0019238817|nr:hypothetical protein [Enterococcus sp. BWR-S5]MBL1226063.1 ybaK/ebsC family protein [Enterococcus sp. BWR-S5]
MFDDLNFKLVVVEALLEKKPSFLAELHVIKSKFVDNYEWYTEVNPKPIPEVLDFLKGIVLSKADLVKVEELVFDGGSTIYSWLIPDWDGEDGSFDVTSVQGFEQLVNLKKVHYLSLCPKSVLRPMINAGIEIC